jgi:hypothetical protein
MARKKMPIENLKTKQINFWLTDTEYENLRSLAESSGLHLNNWLRKYLFSKRFPPVKMSPVTRDTLLELNKIGVNLNQLTRLANATGKVTPFIEPVLRAVEEKVQELKTIILNDSQTNKGKGL